MNTIDAYKLEAGMILEDGREVKDVVITERNEWLTVHIDLTDGSSITKDFYTKVAVRR